MKVLYAHQKFLFMFPVFENHVVFPLRLSVPNAIFDLQFSLPNIKMSNRRTDLWELLNECVVLSK